MVVDHLQFRLSEPGGVRLGHVAIRLDQPDRRDAQEGLSLG